MSNGANESTALIRSVDIIIDNNRVVVGSGVVDGRAANNPPASNPPANNPPANNPPASNPPDTDEINRRAKVKRVINIWFGLTAISIVLFIFILVKGVIYTNNDMDDLQHTIRKINAVLKPFYNTAEMCEFQLQYANESHLQFNVTSRLPLGSYECNRVETGLQYACVTNVTFISSCRYSLNHEVIPEEIVIKYKNVVKKNEEIYHNDQWVFGMSIISVELIGVILIILIGIMLIAIYEAIVRKRSIDSNA